MKSHLAIIIVALFVFTNSAFTQTANIHEKPTDFTWKQVVTDPKIQGLHLPGKVEKWGVADPTGIGKILRAIRFEPITDAVEERYGIPRHTILAMVMHESAGGAAILNSGNDGGAGLSHMQPSIASQFGLKIYGNNAKLVDRVHGAELRKLYSSCKMNWMIMSNKDDRFHPIANLDAVGRMLCHYSQKPVMGMSLTPFERAIFRYAGKYNYSSYLKEIRGFRKQLASAEMRVRIETEFNIGSSKLIINGKPSTYADYMKAQQATLANWGLREYILLGHGQQFAVK
jgi:hypothetical protein